MEVHDKVSTFVQLIVQFSARIIIPRKFKYSLSLQTDNSFNWMKNLTERSDLFGAPCHFHMDSF